MGLDWVLERTRPKKGHEREYAKLRKKLEKLEGDGAGEERLEAVRTALASVSHSAMAEIGAPRVGIDAPATKYFLEQVYAGEVERAKAAGEKPRTREAALAEAHGRYVLELAKDKRGFAGGSFLVSELDYGAGVIDACGDVVRDTSEAWVDHGAKEAAAFAKRLRRDLARAKSPVRLRDERRRDRAKRQGALGPPIAASGTHDDQVWMRVSFRGAMNFDDQVATVKALASWLEYWSKRGYGFRAWS